MQVTYTKLHRIATVAFDRQEVIRIELYAEKTGLKVSDIVEAAIKHGYKDFFQRANDN